MYPIIVVIFMVLSSFLSRTGIVYTAFQGKDSNVLVTVSVELCSGKPHGIVEVQFGKLDKIIVIKGRGEASDNRFSFNSDAPCRMDITIGDTNRDPGPRATVVTVNMIEQGFSFFLRDVTSEFPIIIPEYRVMVLPAGDGRTYEEVLSDIRKKGLRTKLEVIESEAEESFAKAARNTRSRSSPTWLGIPRDFRIFEVDFGLNYYNGQMESIRPKRAAMQVTLPEIEEKPVTYHFVFGRGIGTSHEVKRRLEEGVLPILHTDIWDEDILYETRSFVSLERSLLTEENLRGTHYLVADGYSYGHMFTDDQQTEFDRLEKEELQREEETVLYFEAKAMNTTSTPRYAYFKAPIPNYHGEPPYTFDSGSGFFRSNSGRIFCIAKLNKKPIPFEEISILLEPGETAVIEFAVPHTPLSIERAQSLDDWYFEKRLEECRNFWLRRLSSAARIRLPERRIEEMIKAGLLHLDLITYGLEPEGTLAPKIGVYSPIGSESSPIIQFMNSMGWHNTARRSLQYFLDKQHSDGLIQNFGGYMLETGAALWSMGEYFRYTQDSGWVLKNREKILKSCNYLIDWRNRNKREELRCKGYGMIDGKVADPEDPFHSFMLNGYGYLGIVRVAEMLKYIDPEKSDKLLKEAAAWREDIKASYFTSEIRSPVMPISNGTWCPTAPPWPEAIGPLLLYINPVRQYTHGTFTARDVMLGPLYLVFQEVIDPEEPAAKRLLEYHTDNYYLRNAAFSQPYYSRHAWVELARGMVKPFIKTYYNTFAGLADRETYTFWEHYYHVSPHKTHEEGWFLMQTRWMLWMEEGDTLKFLSGIPRAWLESGKKIELENIATYFGKATLHVESQVDKGWIDAEVICKDNRKPKTVTVRLPHPMSAKASRVSGGEWDAGKEIVVVKDFAGRAKIRMEY